MVWWAIALMLFAVTLAVEHLDMFRDLRPTARELAERERLEMEGYADGGRAEVEMLVLLAPWCCLLAGLIRASFYDVIRVDKRYTEVRRMFLPFLCLRKDQFSVPSHIYCIEGKKRVYSMMKSQGFFVLMVSGRAQICLAGFRREAEAQEWISGLDPRRFRQVRGKTPLGFMPVSAIHFP